jgi:hypothetical protein
MSKKNLEKISRVHPDILCLLTSFRETFYVACVKKTKKNVP